MRNPVDTALFARLAKAYLTSHDALNDHMNPVWDILRDRFDGHVPELRPLIYLLGHEQSTDIRDTREDHIGELIAFAPGVVLLDTNRGWDFNGWCSGLLQRDRPEFLKLYGVGFETKAFSKIEGHSYGLRISPTNDLKHLPPRMEAFPAYMKGTLDRGQTGDGYWGIEATRWNMMKAWLDKWLPA
ncbi:MAG: hypothetical protein Q7R83_03335 [bacterium]|nr:hypothetical protein [bacterium]